MNPKASIRNKIPQQATVNYTNAFSPASSDRQVRRSPEISGRRRIKNTFDNLTVPTMIFNQIKFAIRNITKDFGYSLINILGLTIGISSTLFLLIYVFDELSYDKYNKNHEQIYRVASHITETDDDFVWTVAQIPFATQVKQDYPEVENAIRFQG